MNLRTYRNLDARRPFLDNKRHLIDRGTSLSGYASLVTELGGDPDALLSTAGIRPDNVGVHDAFITYRGLVVALEAAAAATGTRDFGRQLALRQGIEILGPLGVAARTSHTVGEAFETFEKYLAAYSPAISARMMPTKDPARRLFEFQILEERLPPHSQATELSLGVILRVFRLLLGSNWSPLSVHLTHEALTPRRDYLRYFSCTPRFADRTAGFTLRTADLRHPLVRDDATHQALLLYLNSVVGDGNAGACRPVRDLVRKLLPTGAATLEVVALQLGMHPRTLQRHLATESTTFNEVVDEVRREMAERYLRDTSMALGHLSRQLGYAEQSVLSRSCKRWFGTSPAAHRKLLRSAGTTPVS